MRKRILSLLLAVALCMGLCVAPASAAASGACGANVTWSYDEDAGTLTISGTGAMKDYNYGEKIPWQSFSSGIKRVVIQDGVTSVGSRTFANYTSLTSLTIPNSVTSIGDAVFSGCTGLTSLTIPDSVTSIGGGAFKGCTGLTSVTVPSSITSLDQQTFYGCTGLTSVTLKEGLSTISNCMFKGCTGLTSVTIPNSVTEIGDYAFEGCTGLTSVTIPDSVTKIGAHAFGECGNLRSVTFGKGIQKISSNAFDDCPNLTSVTFAEGIKTIPHMYALRSSATEIYVPASVTAVEAMAFDYYSTVTVYGVKGSYMESYCAKQGIPFRDRNSTDVPPEFVIDENGVLTQYNGPGGEINIPDGVVAISKNAFRYAPVTALTLPDSLEYISHYAFEGKELTSLVLPENVFVGNYAFMSCKNLTDVTLPDSAVCETATFGGTPFQKNYNAHKDDEFYILGATLFGYNGHDANVVIPEGVRYISHQALEDLYSQENIESITFPASMKTWLRDFSLNSPDPDLYNANVVHYVPMKCRFNDFLRVKFINFPEYPVEELHWGERDVEACEQAALWVNPFVPSQQSDRVVKLVNSIVAEAGAESDYEKLRAVCNWIAGNVKYDVPTHFRIRHLTPPSGYTWPAMSLSIDGILDGAPTICDGYSTLTRAMASALGIPCTKRVGTIRHGDESIGHAWNEAFVDGQWIVIDTTFMAPGIRKEDGNYVQEGNIRPDYFDAGWLTAISRDFTRSGASEANTPSRWAQMEIRDAFAAKLVPYDLAASYRANITRQEFCRLMTTLIEQSTGKTLTVPAVNPFTDTTDRCVLAAYQLGIVKGTSATTFNPNGAITRQEAAAMLARAARVLGLSAGNGMSFADADQIADWAKEDVGFVSGLTDAVSGSAVMNGTGNGNFSPRSFYTREQAYVTALRLFNCGK